MNRGFDESVIHSVNVYNIRVLRLTRPKWTYYIDFDNVYRLSDHLQQPTTVSLTSISTSKEFLRNLEKSGEKSKGITYDSSSQSTQFPKLE